MIGRAIPARADEPVRRSRPDLSVILPCYRSATLAQRSVATLTAYLDRFALSWEILVVDDGGGDLPDGPLAADSRVLLLRLPVNRGKGAAVRTGMLAAGGRARIFTDVDLPFDPDLIPVAAEYLLSDSYHMVVGDRTLPTARYDADIGWKRRIASRGFSLFVGTMVTGGFFDTQCGFKGVRGDVADLLFRMSRLERFAFDVELVYLGLHHRLDIKRIPVQLRNNDTSSVRVVRDSAQMIKDVLLIKLFQMRGDYDDDVLSRIVVRDFEAQLARNLKHASSLRVPAADLPVRERAVSMFAGDAPADVYMQRAEAP